MATLIGQAIFIILGNKDFLVLLASFSLIVSIFYALLASWKFVSYRINDRGE